MTEKISLVDTIRHYIASGDLELPVFSNSALRVQQELVKKEPDMKVVENIIACDQSLSSQVLKIANSSFYKGMAEILTIKNAIVRLGMQEIGRITLLAASKNVFRTNDKLLKDTMKKLWQHSVGCALGAHWLAKRCKLDNLVGHAFFAGLLHDVGKLFILLVLDQLKKQDSQIIVTQSFLFEAMDNLHTEQGYALMQEWNMPSAYCNIARDHHLENYDANDMVLLLVRMSNMVCNKIGITLVTNSDLVPSTSMEATHLNLTEIDLAELEIMLEDKAILADM